MNNDDVMSSQRLAGLVSRYHVWQTTRRQNVAEHCWQVYRVYCALFGLPRAELAYMILHHDSGEFAGPGDVPFSAKARVPGLKPRVDAAELIGRERVGVDTFELTDLETNRLKVSDLVEMWEFAVEELARGNKFAEPIVTNVLEALDVVVAVSDVDTWQDIREHMKEYDRWK